MQDIYISNGYIQLWVNYLRAQSIEPLEADFLKPWHAKLITLIDQPFNANVPLSLLNEVLAITQSHLNNPQLIFDMAQQVRPEHFGVLGYMATKSNNLSEILNYVMRFQRLVIDGHEFVPVQLKQHADTIQLFWQFLDEKYNVLNELTMAAMLQLARSILEQNQLVLRSVSFAHAALQARQYYLKFFATEVLFGQAHYMFVIDLRGLNLKSAQADPMLLQLLVQQAEQAIADKPSLDGMLEQAQKHIAESLRIQQHAIKIEHLAAQMHLSTRTLQRYLHTEGTSFKQLLEQERIKRCEWLLQQNLSLIDIAQQLDYSDQSALARAYKAATGQTLLNKKKQLKIHEHKKSG